MLSKNLSNILKRGLQRGVPCYSFGRILIKNGTIVNAHSKFKGDVLINGSKIE